ncbi:hypothetical protein N8881_00225 [Pseudomonadales bacterium]|nr:hypothetical protein [Pseudomonadales bacterium]
MTASDRIITGYATKDVPATKLAITSCNKFMTNSINQPLVSEEDKENKPYLRKRLWEDRRGQDQVTGPKDTSKVLYGKAYLISKVLEDRAKKPYSEERLCMVIADDDANLGLSGVL